MCIKIQNNYGYKHTYNQSAVLYSKTRRNIPEVLSRQ